MKFYQTFIIVAALFLSVSFASAESASTSNMRMKDDSRRMEVKDKMMEMRRTSSTSEARVEKCTALTTRIGARLDGFGAKYEQHKKAYDAHKENLLAISAKLEAKGVVTTQLKADIALLDTKIAKLATDKEKVKAALENTKSTSCGDKSGEFKAAVEAAREAQKEVAADAADIAAFIKGTLKQDMIDLRASFKTQI